MENNKLKKGSLNIVETIALSAAIMAPSASMALTMPLIIGISNYSIGIIFVFAMILTVFISISIIRFNKHLPSAGSLYAFTKVAVGKKLGFVSGWTLFFTYFLLALGSAAAFGSYISGMLELFGIHIGWLPISLVFSAVVWLLAFRNIKLSTHVMLVLEGLSIALILVLDVVIFIKVGLSKGVSTAPLLLNGNGISTMARGTVMAMLCFAGFEGTSCLGEETKNPKKNIPVVIIGTIVLIGSIFLISGYSQVIGFGVNAKGISALVSSPDPFGDLAKMFISSKYALLVTLGISMSLFSCAIGCVCASSRILFSISRDGLLQKKLSKVHREFDTPHIAVSSIMIFLLVIQLIYFIFTRTGSSMLFNTAFITASLSILVAYLLTSLSGIIYFTKMKIWKAPNLVMPILAILVLLFAFFCNIYPAPPFPFNVLPYVVLAWIIIGFVISALTKHQVDFLAASQDNQLIAEPNGTMEKN
jgi:amino acid transporter